MGLGRSCRRVAILKSLCEIKPEDCTSFLILEIGCGTGKFSEKISEWGTTFIGLDISFELVRIAKEKGRGMFVVGDTEFLPFKEKSFNDVIGISILHHVDVDKSLKEIGRVLKNNGRIVFTEPNMMNPQILIQKNFGFIKKRMGETPHETAFFRWKIARKFVMNGFKNVLTKPFDFLHPKTPSFLVPFVEAFGNVVEKIPFVKEIAGSLIICATKSE